MYLPYIYILVEGKEEENTTLSINTYYSSILLLKDKFEMTHNNTELYKQEKQ